MKKINIGGFDAVDLGENKNSCGMHIVVVLNTPKFRYALGSIPNVYVDPRRKATKNNLFLLMGTREQYIALTGGMQETPWFITKRGSLTKKFTYKR